MMILGLHSVLLLIGPGYETVAPFHLLNYVQRQAASSAPQVEKWPPHTDVPVPLSGTLANEAMVLPPAAFDLFLSRTGIKIGKPPLTILISAIVNSRRELGTIDWQRGVASIFAVIQKFIVYTPFWWWF